MKLLFAATFALFVLSAFDQADSSAYDKIVAHSRIRAKKEGPNVCALQQVVGTKKKYFSTCRNWYQGAICGKKATVLYECCPGYMKLDGMRGCPAVAPIDNVFGTVGLVKATTTQDYSALSKLREEIEGAGSYTFFAPSNDAWDLLDPVTAHSFFLPTGYVIGYLRLHEELILHVVLVQVVTVNCARIIHGNQVATNGVVHVTDRVITAVGNTIQDVIEVDDDLSTLSTVATASGLIEKLGQPGHFTLFAPTNDAFDKLDREVLDRLMEDKNSLQALLNYHLLNSVQCSEAIMAGTSYETQEGSNIEIGCDGDSLTVNGIKMVLKKDIVTTNGVIHLIDQVLMPDSAKQVMELVGQSQGTFSDMLTELGLSAAMRPQAEYTLLAPLNTAFNDEVMSMDQSFLKIILENHILKNKIVLSQLYNGQRLETLAGKFLRVFVYRTAVCIENACLIRGSKEGNNGALHLMKTLITPADSSMYQLLVKNGAFKIFLSLMEAAGLNDLLKQEGDFTLFAPTDEAFAGLSERDLSLLKSDVNALRAILLYHFSNSIFIGGGLETGVTNLLKTLQGSNLKVLFVSIKHSGCPALKLISSHSICFRDTCENLYQSMIPLCNIKFYVQREPTITKVTRVIESPTKIKKVTRVIEGQPSVTKVTRVIEGDPTMTKVTRVIEGNPSVTTAIEGKHHLTHP
uniref:Periostin-like n=1 Tax=Sinocyclocheilus rhinocerous TaxID=307959 RepID=A0A673NB37_9TELE